MENDLEVNVRNGTSIINLLDEIEYFIRDYLNLQPANDEDLTQESDPSKGVSLQFLKSFLQYKIPECKRIFESNIELFENHDFAEIIWNELYSLRETIAYSGTNKLVRIVDRIKVFTEKFETIKLSIIALQNANKLIVQELQPAINEVKEKVKDFEAVRLALEQRETSSIYLELHNKYNEEYEANNLYFYSILGLSIFFTILSILISASFKPIDWMVFVSSKVLILAIGITLCTLFLRRAAHAKKLKEQAYQTHVEINAFPIHVRSLKDEDKQELIKELALKYFGKELDHTQNDKIGDLMQDQLAAGTELIKASAEIVKSVKPSGVSESNEPK